MTPQRRHRRCSRPAGCWLGRCILLCAALFGSDPAWSQPEPSSPRPVAPAAETPPAAPAPGATPRLEPTADEEIPPYHFSPLKLTGTVDPDGKLARLQVEMEVHINHPAVYHDVPLRLTQAAVTHVEYEGPQEPVPVPPKTPDDGVHWLFRGLGRHRLRLDLVVELRTVAAGTNLQLTLPSGSRFFPTQLTLTIPQARLALEEAKDHTVLTETTMSGETIVRSTIIGNRVDLTWRSLQERRGSVSRVLTSIALDPLEDRLRMQATQDLVTDGLVQEVRVRPPRGFQLLSVGGRDYAGHRRSEGSPDWVDVQLASRERNDVQLEWLLESETPLRAGNLSLDGFEVQGALGQSGTIGLAPLPGFKVLRLATEDDTGIDREEPRRLRPAKGIAQLKWAWRFDRQPFELSLDVQEQRPAFDVRTRAVVATEATRTTLDVEFLVQVHVGRVQELLLRWPNPQSEDWVLTAADDAVLSDATDERSQFPGEFQRVVLPAPREGEFSVRLQFQRAATPGRFEFSLPRPETERALPAWLIVRGVDSVKPQLDADQPLSALADPAAVGWLASRSYDAQQDQAYALEQPEAVLTGELTLYPLELSAQSLVSLSPTGGDGIDVEQAIELDIQYGRIDEVSFAWPKAFAPEWRAAGSAAIECRLANGEPLPLEARVEQLKLRLPDAVKGRMQLNLAYRVPVEAGADAVDIPIFHPQDARIETVRVESRGAGAWALQPVSETWRRVVTSVRPTWIAPGAPDGCEISLAADVRASMQRFQVETAYARVTFDAAGGSRTIVDYVMREAGPEIALELPAGANSIQCTWNDLEPLQMLVSELPAGGVRLDLQLGRRDERTRGRLRLEYLLPGVGSLDEFRRLPIALPVAPDTVSTTTTYLELGLPSDYCLLTYPGGLTPLFTWQPGVVFQRQLTPAYLEWRRGFPNGDAARAADADASGVAPAPHAAGHVYAFWTTGGVAQAEFRSIRLWALILVGSGLTLALAFVLWSVPALRSVLTLLVIGFAVAVGGVFVPESVELLLQPVLLGLLAAVVAIGLQGQGRRAVPVPNLAAEALTRAEHSGSPPRTASDRSSGAAVPTTNLDARELQESGSRS